MTRRFGKVFGFGFAAMLLAGCGALSLSAFDVTAGFSPTSLGFEVDEDGITIAAHNVTFVSEAGSIGGVITGYEMQFYDQTGTPFVAGSPGVASDHGLAHPVPAGIACVTSVPCRLTSEDRYFQRQVSEPLGSFVSLPGPVALTFLDGGTVAGSARGHFVATTDNGRVVEIPFVVPIQYPVEP